MRTGAVAKVGVTAPFEKQKWSEMADETQAPFDGKRLFTVEIEQSVVVLAATEKAAEEIAKDVACGHDIEWLDAMYSAYESPRLPDGWDKTQPYGHEGRETCEQILEALEEYERTRPPTLAELEAMGQQPLIADR